LSRRKADTFGIGYFYAGLSTSLKNLDPDLMLRLRHEYGLEPYYNVAVTRWCQITPDFQVVKPTLYGVASSLTLGVRAKVDF
jgi:porin